MPTNVTNFLHSLAKAIATACSISFPAAITPAAKSALWVGSAIESLATDPYTVLSDYGGDADAWTRAWRISVQLATTGTGRDAVRARAWAIYEAMRASDGRPWRAVTLTGIVAGTQAADGTWKIVRADAVQPPGFVGGPDEAGRVSCVFNVDVEFLKAT